ncbi:rhodanese-like domain-containing protein [Rathayibacter toxicus]|uniref:Rhodanese domain-containing protein n=1 Tax=Rathayibacter toxicus TaxID=145458 RepID=A0A0C5BFD4_9MICO|nr:hypothetical protein TI83_07255 [Rathayibacter toxicus]KKM44270.1 hypothetical protein VT73_10200 [Rathayibacter toxicus]PPG20290.1 rhodanese-like domain-containing protein [Rathayibacter toxicus]PPG45390.1 rhodanese-like domain-containing protein [Rathayibacter toxicus]PPH62836.1 rhodanese-like domain-containing protein [Rathayibacter toxicus]
MRAEVTQVSAADAVGLVAREEAWLLDVRELHEWALGHAPTSHHIPMAQIGERQDDLPRDAPILVVCHSGVRSATVAQALDRAGYRVANLVGGMTAWAGAGGAVIDCEGRGGRVD